MKKGFFILCTQVIFCLPAFAFKVSPIEMRFETHGLNSTQTIKLENNEDKDVPIELNLFERQHINGKEIRKPTKDFNIFPTQLILKPKEKRSIRISWMGERGKVKFDQIKKNQFLAVGNRKIKQEKSYRLEVKQIPINIKRKRKKTGIDFIYNYVASLYVTPQNAEPNLVGKEIMRVAPNKILAQVQNLGSSHAILAQYKIKAESMKSGGIYSLDDQLEYIRGINMLPSEIRKIELKLPPGVPRERLKIQFKKL